MQLMRAAMLSLRMLSRNPLRAALAILGIAVAVFLLCVERAVHAGVQEATAANERDTRLIVYRANRFCPFTSRIPERYLEQMLTGLRKAGLLNSIRGPRGGFQLALNPDNITVADVVAALDGSSNTEPQREPDDPAFLVLAALEQELEASKEALLSATTLAQLLREHDALKQPLPMFYI